MTTVVFAVGARPNFVKMAPVIEAVGRRGLFRQLVVHTGQHYDERMSTEILTDLGFPKPDRFLGVGSGSHGEQTGFTLIAFERVLLEERPDLVVVSGDVNATLACSLAASKLGIPIAHVESGLRSRDWTMPEEQNRVLTDRLSDLLFTHSPDANENLRAEGIAAEKIHYVGNTMIDTLRRLEREARGRRVWASLGAEENAYALVTLHRPSNVDDEESLRAVVEALAELGRHTHVLFPVHPRTRARLDALGGLAAPRGRRRDLSRAARLSRLPLARVRRGPDRHGLRRPPGGGCGARRPVLHAPGEYGAADHPHPGNEHLDRRRPGCDRDPPTLGRAARTVRDPALGRARGGARGGRDRDRVRVGRSDRDDGVTSISELPRSVVPFPCPIGPRSSASRSTA